MDKQVGPLEDSAALLSAAEKHKSSGRLLDAEKAYLEAVAIIDKKSVSAVTS